MTVPINYEQADEIVKKAEAAAAALVSKGESELSFAAKQSLTVLKQEAVNIHAGNILGKEIPAALTDPP